VKIIRLTTSLDFGGQERQYISFSENKDLLLYEYIFAAIGKGGNASKTILDRGFKVKLFNKNPSVYNLKNIWILYKWFKNEKPDIIHTAAAEANFHGIIAAKLANINTVFAEEIGLPNHSVLARVIYKCLYRMTNGVICVSTAVKKWLIDLNEISNKQGIVIYNPVSLPISISMKKTQDFNIVYLGRLEIVKNVSFLIRGFSKIKNKEKIKLTIVGDGRERKPIEDLISTLQLKNKIHLVGYSKVPENFLAQANLFVLPSLSEGFGIAAVEAMYQGIPCLCSNVGGIPEFIKEDSTGWLFNPKDLDGFSQKLESIIQLPKDELNKVGQLGKKYVLERFIPEKYIQDIQKVYTEAVL